MAISRTKRSLVGALLVSPVAIYIAWSEAKKNLVKPLFYQYQCSMSAVKLDKRRILIVGDSRVGRWQPVPSLHNVEFIMRGVGGEKLQALYERLPLEIECHKPDSIIIQSGINDIVAASLMNRDKGAEYISKILSYFQSIFLFCQKLDIKCYISTIIPASTPSGFYRVAGVNIINEYVQNINSWIKDFSDTLPHQDLLDFSVVLADPMSGYLIERYRVDTLHINNDAYEHLNQVVTNSIKDD